MKRILVCGGRDYGKVNPKKTLEFPKRKAEQRRAKEILDEFFNEFGPFVLIHGGADGADKLAHEWARDKAGMPKPEEYPAAWGDISRPGAVVRQGKNGPYDVLAGFVRNQKMVDIGKPDIVIAFPGGRGTADMVRRSRDAKLEVHEISK